MKLSQWLEEQGLSRQEFAGRIGVHPVTVSKWGGGKMVPRADAMRAITEATRGAVTANDFFDGPCAVRVG